MKWGVKGGWVEGGLNLISLTSFWVLYLYVRLCVIPLYFDVCLVTVYGSMLTVQIA